MYIDGTLQLTVWLNWDPVPGADWYEVRYREVGTTDWSGDNDLGVVYTSIGLGQGFQNPYTRYEYQVRAGTNVDGAGEWSESITVWVDSAMALLDLDPERTLWEPGNLRSIETTEDSVRLVWNGVAVENSVYDIRYKKAGDLDENDKNTWEYLLSQSSPMTIAGLEPGTVYLFQIRSRVPGDDYDVHSEWSSTVPICTHLAIPENLQTTDISYDYITLEWDAVDGADRYLIEYRTPDGDWTQLADVTENSFTHEFDPEAPRTYEYRVRALKDGFGVGFMEAMGTGWRWVPTGEDSDDGEYRYFGQSWIEVLYNRPFDLDSDVNSDWSEIWTETAYIRPPEAPSDPYCLERTTDSITLKWSSTERAEWYIVEFSTDGEHWTEIGGIITSTSYTVTSLQPYDPAIPTEHFYRVRAENRGSESKAEDQNEENRSKRTSGEVPLETLPLKPYKKVITKKGTGYASVKGFKADKSKAELNAVAFTWTPGAKHAETDKLRIEVYDPKVKGTPIITVEATIRPSGLIADFPNLPPAPGTIDYEVIGNDYVVVITAATVKGALQYTISITGLDASTKYTAHVQAAKEGTDFSKMVKASASTKKYTPLKGFKVDSLLKSPQSIALTWNSAKSVAEHKGLTDLFIVEVFDTEKVSLATFMINGNGPFGYPDYGSFGGSDYWATVENFGTPYMTIKIGGLEAQTRYTVEITAFSTLYNTGIPNPVKLSAKTAKKW